MPRTVLSAVHNARFCRLHMHHFHLRCAVLPRNGPPQTVNIDQDDRALAASPALFSVVAGIRDYELDGQLNYTEEALLAMAAGAAPNLQHL